uniref:PVII n=1 Tax=Angiostrongylus cantonensis TaxID=6313 RepID=A0A0K0DEN2_ANGCA
FYTSVSQPIPIHHAWQVWLNAVAWTVASVAKVGRARGAASAARKAVAVVLTANVARRSAAEVRVDTSAVMKERSVAKWARSAVKANRAASNLQPVSRPPLYSELELPPGPRRAKQSSNI